MEPVTRATPGDLGGRIAEVMRGDLDGWDLFEAMREKVVAKKWSTEEYYRKHLNGDDPPHPRRMDSLLHDLKWRDDNPVKDTPPEVRRMRTDRQHAEWLKQGQPTIDREVTWCGHCGTWTDPPKPRSVVRAKPIGRTGKRANAG